MNIFCSVLSQKDVVNNCKKEGSIINVGVNKKRA